jgi:DNA-binding GntR family transcriptional regulator
MAVTGVLPRTRAAAVAEELRAAILEGRLSGGERLRQTEIAREFRVSTTPVREALAILEQEGLVTRDAHRGAVVFQPTRDDLRQNYEVRIALESFTAGIAAQEIDDGALAPLEDVVVRMRGEQDPFAYNKLNRIFHDAIYAAARRPQLATLIGELRDASEIYLRMLAAAGSTPRQAHREHEDIFEALVARSAERAAAATAVHLRARAAAAAEHLGLDLRLGGPAPGA